MSIFGSIAGAVVGGLFGKKASDNQASAARDAAAVQREAYQTTRRDLQPFTEAGVNALSTYSDQVNRPFEETPGYQFRLRQGLDAIEASRAARGGLFSGATGQALNNYAQGQASQEYGNYMNRLQGLTNLGQSSAAMQGAASQNFANQQTNTLAAMGNAQAAGNIAMGNALNTGINNAVGYHQYNTLLDRGFFG